MTTVQNAYASKNARTIGQIQRPEICDIDSTKMGYNAAGIAMGLVVSRRTSFEGTQIVPGGANVLGITVRGGELGAAADGDNVGLYLHQKQSRVIRSGYVSVAVTGTAVAGEKTFAYNTTTGAITVGAVPGDGEAALYGLTLEDNVTTSGVVLVRCDDIRSDPGYLSDVTFNGASVVTNGVAAVTAIAGVKLNTVALVPTAGVVDVTAITGVKLNGAAALTPTAGVVDAPVVESIKANDGTALVGAIQLTDSDTIELTQTDVGNIIDIGTV